MSIAKRAGSLGLSAALLASLVATVAAPAALASTSVTGVGNVIPGTTSSGTATFTLTERSATAFPTTAATLQLYIEDAAGSLKTLHFVGTPTVTAPASLGATVTVSSKAPGTNNQLTISITGSDTASVEAIVISGLKISADATAKAGAMQAWLATAVSNTANNAFLAALVGSFPTTGTASGKLASAIGIGATAFNIAVDASSACYFVAPSATYPIVMGADSFTSATVGAYTAGNQAVSAASPATTTNHLANEVITQTVPLGGPGPSCGAFDSTVGVQISSPGTVVAGVIYASDGQANVRPGRNYQSADDLTVTETQAGVLASGTVLTFTVTTPGVTLSQAPCVSLDSGDGVVLSPANLLPSRTVFTVTVKTASSATADVIRISCFEYDVAANVTAGTAVNVTLASGVPQDSTSQSNAIVNNVITVNALAQPLPTVFIGFNGQNTSVVEFKEIGPGYFTDSSGSNNKFWVCVQDAQLVDEEWTSAPWAVVSGGNLTLIGPAGTAVTQAQGTLVSNSYGDCYYWAVYAASTTASTVDILGANATGTAPLPMAPTNGPQINVYPDAAPGVVVFATGVGNINSGGFVSTTYSLLVPVAVRAFKNSLTISAASQPVIAPGAVSAKAGNIHIAETQFGQLDSGDFVCVELVPRGSTTQLISGIFQSKHDVFMTASTTNGLPIPTTNANASGLIVSPVMVFGPFQCADLQNSQGHITPKNSLFNILNYPSNTGVAFGFYVEQGTTNVLGTIDISNLWYTALSDAALGPVQVNVSTIPDSGIQQSQGLITNATIGTVQPVVMSADSATSASGPFTTSTKILSKGQTLTVRIRTNPQLAGKSVGIWIAVKGANGTWGAYKPHASATADVNGVVTYSYKAGSKTWLAFRAYYGGDALHSAAWSYPSVFGRWM